MKNSYDGGSRLHYISALRVLAMIMVLTPHLLAYRIDTMAFRYLAHYILNPLHIIQFTGAIGVCIFFITSGYLTYKQVGSKNYFRRFYKNVIIMIVQVFIAIMFVCIVVNVFEKIFFNYGYTSTYSGYNFGDWFQSALLCRNLFFLESCEAALWFLVPFLFFKILLLLFDFLNNGDKSKVLFCFWGCFIVGYVLLKLMPSHSIMISLLTERFFYIGVILIGYIFALFHDKKITVDSFIAFVVINGLLMLIGTHLTIRGIDNGYIVQAIYATILFVLFYKAQNRFHYNRFISFIDSVGLSFFLLHNGIGWILLQLFYYCLLPGHAYMSMFFAVCLDLFIIIGYDCIIQKSIDRMMRKLII